MSKFVTTVEDAPPPVEVVELSLKTQVEQAAGREMLNKYRPPPTEELPPEVPPPIDPNAPHPDHTLPGDLPPDPPTTHTKKSSSAGSAKGGG